MTTYYVDSSTAGSDSNSGLSSFGPWRTLAKVNAASVQPGDSVLFLRGGSWIGQLTISWSGTAGNVITFGAYGDPAAARPILDAQSAVNTNTIYNIAHSYLVYRDLDLRGGYSSCCYNDGQTGTTTVVPITTIDVINCVASGAGNDNILFIHNCSNVRILGCESVGAKDSFAGQVSTGIEIADGGTNNLIDSCRVHGNPTGISVHCHAPSGSFPNGFTLPGVTISNTEVYHCIQTGVSASGNGIQVSNGLPSSSPNFGSVSVTITDCHISDVQITGSGLKFGKDATSAANMAGAITVARCTITSCNFYSVDIDGADDVTLSRVLCTPGSQSTNRGLRVRNAQRINLYHVTAYRPTNTGVPLLIIDQSNSSTTEYTDQVTVKNCIFGSPDTSAPMVQVTPTALLDLAGVAAAKTLTLDYNLYWQDPTRNRWVYNQASVSSGGTFAAWQTAVAGEAHSLTATTSPFVDHANGNYRLAAGVSAIDAAVAIPGVNDSYAGAAPDIGYLERVQTVQMAQMVR